jgi:hypothetical protein
VFVIDEITASTTLPADALERSAELATASINSDLFICYYP